MSFEPARAGMALLGYNNASQGSAILPWSLFDQWYAHGDRPGRERQYTAYLAGIRDWHEQTRHAVPEDARGLGTESRIWDVVATLPDGGGVRHRLRLADDTTLHDLTVIIALVARDYLADPTGRAAAGIEIQLIRRPDGGRDG